MLAEPHALYLVYHNSAIEVIHSNIWLGEWLLQSKDMHI